MVKYKKLINFFMKKKSVKEILAKEGNLIYPIKGTSMLPLLHEGHDQVHLKKCDDYELYDVVLFQSGKASYILHRIVGINDGVYAIIGDNSFRVDYKTKDEILGKMVGFYQKDKYISVDDQEYIDYLEKRILHREDEFAELLKDSEAYFYKRFKDAYYEIVRIAIDPNYQIDISKINKLCVSEKYRLMNTLATKKAEHILGYALNKFDIEFDEKPRKYLLNSLEISKLRYIRLEEAKAAITKVLNAAGIRHMFLKGAVVRDIYKNPYFRWSNDIDLYVDEKDIEKARQVFIDELKCTFFSECEHHLVFENDEYKLHFELHHILDTALPNDLTYLLNSPFDDAIADEKYPYLYHQNINKFYLFHVIHMIKHIAAGEFWLPMMTDTYMLNKTYEIDNSILKEARLEEFNTVFTHICDSIFNSNIELTDAEIELEKFLFRNAEEIYSTVAKGSKKNGFTYLLSIIFPKYKAMKFIYPVLKKAPILLPFCYIARIVTRVFNPKKFRMGVDKMHAYHDAKGDEISVFNNAGLQEYILIRDKK